MRVRLEAENEAESDRNNHLNVIAKLTVVCQTGSMKTQTPGYRGYRFPSEIISHAVWLYHRFCLSFREIEDLLAERGITRMVKKLIQPCDIGKA